MQFDAGTFEANACRFVSFGDFAIAATCAPSIVSRLSTTSALFECATSSEIETVPMRNA